MNQKIVIISSTCLAANPRVVKELKYAATKFREVIFIGFDVAGWTNEIEVEIQKSLSDNVTTKYISATRKPFLPWFFSSIIQIFNHYLSYIFPKHIKSNAYSSNKRTWLLNKFLNKNISLLENCDLIVAHTLGTLYPTHKMSKQLSIPFAFDVEDFHPGEYIDKYPFKEKKRRVLLMKNLLPEAKYISYASPLIGKYTLEILPKQNHNHLLINNSFSIDEITADYSKLKLSDETLNLVWYSQNITFGRGLEYILAEIYNFPNMKLYLIGNLDVQFDKKYNCSSNNQIEYLGVLKHNDLNACLKLFDIGLATDYAAKDLNRDLALTNKIITYYQAGLFIFAFNTLAQQKFISETAEGICININSEMIKNSFKTLLKDKNKIKLNKLSRFNKAKELAWEKECLKLEKLWGDL